MRERMRIKSVLHSYSCLGWGATMSYQNNYECLIENGSKSTTQLKLNKNEAFSSDVTQYSKFALSNRQ